jgi:hypothetical protein
MISNNFCFGFTPRTSGGSPTFLFGCSFTNLRLINRILPTFFQSAVRTIDLSLAMEKILLIPFNEGAI